MSEDIEQLRELGNELAETMQSPWEPTCIARAFATPLPGDVVLTMQRWIDLAYIHSPLLMGLIPEDFSAVTDAADIFDLDLDELSIEAVADLSRAMLAATDRAFAAGLGMRPRESEPMANNDGFGDWLPTFACLVTQCGLSEVEALAIRVDRAFMLIAGKRRNEGWISTGVPYAMRDKVETEEVPVPEKEDEE